MPGGAFYVFPDVAQLGGGDAFTERLLKEALIAATPGSKAAKQAEYPPDVFAEKLPAMRQAVADGKMDAAKVIAHCEKTGKLTDEQKAAISAPITEDAQ